MIRKLKTEDIDGRFMEIMHQDGVRGYNGLFIESEDEWFKHFFNDDRCYVFGLFKNGLTAIIIAEKLSDNGCLLWYLAVHPDCQLKGYGKKILRFFERYIKIEGIKWIYLTASMNSLGFYAKNGYETSEYSVLKEHVKNL